MTSRLSNLGIYLASLLLLTGLAATPALCSDTKDAGKKTLNGVVSDSMCGAKHMMPGNPADCTHACVKQGSKYALVVGEKVYTLDTSDKAVLEQLDKLAGEKATISGSVKGDTIEVSSVSGS